MRHLLPAVAALLLALPASAQPPASFPGKQLHAGELAAALHRLGVVGSVLYVAAHPDDENTKLLAYLVGDRGLRAGYLSMTRGDGGQNLLGTEQDELLGLIRTYELLAARRIDGAEQFFTRARDLGFTKSATEALRIWGHDAALADLVLQIRRFRPDVIVTRFNTRPPNHGHHTASALLAAEAFTAAADPKRFPEQLSDAPAWRADRLLHNVSNWNLPKDADLSMYLHLDVGGFDPWRGRSWGEVAAESRSQHKSQGFGVAAERGPALEHFQPLQGTLPKADVFEGLDLTWHRFPGTEALVQAIAAAERGWDARHPERSIPALVKVHGEMVKLPDSNPWKTVKLQETETLLGQCAGLLIEARATEPNATPGSEVALTLQAINRSGAAIRLVSVQLPGHATETLDQPLEHHKPVSLPRKLRLAEDAPISTPYWLKKPAAGGLYEVPEARLIGRPEGDPALAVTFGLDIAGLRVTVARPVQHVWVDPVRGERYRAFEVVPEVTATLDRHVTMVQGMQPAAVTVQLESGRDDARGTVRLAVPQGWVVEPREHAFTLGKRGDQQTVQFLVHMGTQLLVRKLGPPARTPFRVETVVAGKTASWNVHGIAYDHVPPLAVRQESTGELVAVELAIVGKKLGYIPGPGDRVAECLTAVGYEVTLLPEERLASENLQKYDAILVGIRAFNANPRLGGQRDRLLKYVENGGRVVVQYQTNSRFATLSVPVGPYPAEIGRDRVTDEAAEMTPVDPKDPLLDKPNRLGPADFAGWVQERGLYFASKWDPKYRAVFSIRDTQFSPQEPAEVPQLGSVLVAQYGKGTFTYTGLAFFRELPAGVPGAYRLLANLLAP
jgi:LmbE family N-acetylglucosaminyl deacetylase